MNPFRALRDRCLFAQNRIASIKHQRAWVGLLLITGAATITVIAIVYAIVIETNHKGGAPIDPPGDHESHPPRYDYDGGCDNVSDWRTHAVAPRAGQVVIQTVYSTAMVHITPAFTPKSAPTISTTEAAPMTELDKSVTKSDADQPDVMTGNMFCLATNRQHNVYTPCPRTHTSQTGMVEATAVPNAVVESTAKGQESSNPLALLKNAMVMIRRSVAIHIGALSQAANDAKVVVEGKCYHSHARELLDENHKLKEGLEYALQVVRMQQELLDSQHRVIEDQRSSIEELTKLWVSLQTERLLGRSTSNHNMNN